MTYCVGAGAGRRALQAMGKARIHSVPMLNATALDASRSTAESFFGFFDVQASESATCSASRRGAYPSVA